MGGATVDVAEAFERDGFAVVRGAVPEATLDGVRAVCAAAVDAFAQTWLQEGLISDACEDAPFDKRFAALRVQHRARFPDTWRRILVSPAVYALWRTEGILDAVRQVTGDEVVAHSVWNGRPREPKAPVQRIPWHQDAFYYPAWSADDGALVTCWIPLVPVDERSGCLQVVRGSHAKGLLAPEPSDGQLIVSDDRVHGDAVSVPLEPGDVLLFHALTLHRALDNVADYVRWNLDIRFGQATEPIVAKNPQGYVCHSADRSRVEDFDTWAARYGAPVELSADGLAAFLRVQGDTVDDVLHAAKLSRSELRAW